MGRNNFGKKSEDQAIKVVELYIRDQPLITKQIWEALKDNILFPPEDFDLPIYSYPSAISRVPMEQY